MNEIVSVSTQAPYAAYQQQPAKTQLNRSGFFIKYELKEEIGVGSTSKCYRCSRKSDGQNFACKVIDKRQVEVKFTGLLDQFFVEINVRANHCCQLLMNVCLHLGQKDSCLTFTINTSSISGFKDIKPPEHYSSRRYVRIS